jgi:hypothetical protein
MSRSLLLVYSALLLALDLPKGCVCQGNQTITLDEEFAEELQDSADLTGSVWATALLCMEAVEALHQLYQYFSEFAVKREHELPGVHASFGAWTFKRVRWEKRAAVSFSRNHCLLRGRNPGLASYDMYESK